jgi:hypothetical protein
VEREETKRCLGGGKPPVAKSETFLQGLRTGVCPTCGERLTLYLGVLIPKHPTPVTTESSGSDS